MPKKCKKFGKFYRISAAKQTHILREIWRDFIIVKFSFKIKFLTNLAKKFEFLNKIDYIKINFILISNIIYLNLKFFP